MKMIWNYMKKLKVMHNSVELLCLIRWLRFLLLIFTIFTDLVRIIGVIYWEYTSCYSVLNICNKF